MLCVQVMAERELAVDLRWALNVHCFAKTDSCPAPCPDWLQLRATCERDAVHRAASWVAPAAARPSRTARVPALWHDDGIEVSDIGATYLVIPQDGKGLLLVPSAFVWPHAAARAAPAPCPRP